MSTFDKVIEWEKMGEVSMGMQEKELFIQWQGNSTIGYCATVKNNVDDLSCNSACENIPYEGVGIDELSAHNITDMAFNIDLGFYEGMDANSHWYLTGVKM